jgi:hypothetical protein
MTKKYPKKFLLRDGRISIEPHLGQVIFGGSWLTSTPSFCSATPFMLHQEPLQTG